METEVKLSDVDKHGDNRVLACGPIKFADIKNELLIQCIGITPDNVEDHALGYFVRAITEGRIAVWDDSDDSYDWVNYGTPQR